MLPTKFFKKKSIKTELFRIKEDIGRQVADAARAVQPPQRLKIGEI